MILIKDKLLIIIVLSFLTVLCIAGACLGYVKHNKSFYDYNVFVNNVSDNFSISEDGKNIQIDERFRDTDVLPDFINLDVPFITQAPFRLWKTYPFNYTCEEAAVLMVHYYLSGKKIVNEDIIKQELLAMVNFENERYGFSNDTDAVQTAKLIADYYGYDVKIVYNPSLETIKRELALGNPVIVPTAGRLLKNPYFTPPGPLYHMLVIKGYDSEGFITNDPGTYTTGRDYKYPYEVLQNAIRDFDLKNTGEIKKTMLVVTKK